MIQSRAVPQIPVAAREDRRMEWLTVSKAAERSRRITTENREGRVCRDSLTARSAVSVEWLGLKLDWCYWTVVLNSGGVQSGFLQ